MAIDVTDVLTSANAVLRNMHFGLTSGEHSTDYVNVRAILPRTATLAELAAALAEPFLGQFDVVLGPETGGRSLAQAIADYLYYTYGEKVDIVWADINGQGDKKVASFNSKFGFVELLRGKRILLVDDLLTTGTTELAVLKALNALDLDCEIVGLAVVVSRNDQLACQDFNLRRLHILTYFLDMETWTAEDCAAQGPCSKAVPMVTNIGRGKEWLANNPTYAGGGCTTADFANQDSN